MAATLPLAVDPGSGYLKVGLAGTPFPALCYPAVVGHPKASLSALLDDQHGIYYGYEALKRSCMLHVRAPCQSGVVTNWDDYLLLIDQAISAFKPSASDTDIILAEPPLRPLKERQRLAENLFESSSVHGLHFSPTNFLALLSVGKTMGIALDSGDTVTSCMGVYEGDIQLGSVSQFAFGGRDLLQRVAEIMRATRRMVTAGERELARFVKENCCVYAYEEVPPEKGKEEEAKETKLPDGTTISLKRSELMSVTETLFKGSGPFGGIIPMLMKSMEGCLLDTRPTLLKNIVLAGGNLAFPGMAQRVRYEVKHLLQPMTEAEVTAGDDCAYAAWKGASVLGRLSSIKGLLLTRKEYEECGFRGLLNLS